MKLTERELETLAMLRRLPARQRNALVARVKRQLEANRLVQEISGLRSLTLVDDRAIERAFGKANSPKQIGGRS